MISRSILIPSIACIVLCAWLTGCSSLLKQPSAVITYYQPEYPPPEAASTTLDSILLIRPLCIQAPYDRDSIVYHQENGISGFYSYDQWISSPDDLVSAKLIRDFRTAGLFHAVVAPGMFRVPDYELTGTIIQISEVRDPQSKNSSGIVRMIATLVGPRTSSSSGSILFQKEYHSTTPCTDNTPEAVVQAISTSLKEISAAIITDVQKAVEDN